MELEYHATNVGVGGSNPSAGARFRIDSANHLAKLFGCLATKAILFYLLGHGVMVTQRALNSLSLVRFQVPLPIYALLL